MITRPIALVAIAGFLHGCSGVPELNTGFAGLTCSKAELSEDRNIYVCDGGPVNLETFKRSLIQKADADLDPKEIGRTFDIPPSEISGVLPASSTQEDGVAPEVIRVNKRSFAVYQREGATVFVER